MSFISSVKRALGFPGEFESDEFDDDDDINDDDLVDDPDPATDPATADAESIIDLSANSSSEPIQVVDDTEIKALASDMFDSVLAYFNSHQPEVVKQCIDIDAQRTLLLNESCANMKQRLEGLALAACRKGENLWADKQQKMGAELMKLRSEYNSVRQQREEFQSAQLSAQRQKRALTDRIRDLETQVTNLEAEREQFQLENRSMASRLRALDNGTPMPAIAPVLANDAETAALRDENGKLMQQIDALNATIAEMRTEVESLKNKLAEQPDPDELTPEQEEELREIERQIMILRDLKEKAEAKAVDLNKELKASDATIAQLQKQLADSAKAAEATDEEIATLRSTIEANLYTHAASESELRNRIAQLEARLNEPPTVTPTQPTPKPEAPAAETASIPGIEPQAPEKPAKRKRRQRNGGKKKAEQHVKISAIDELMDSTDWFVAPDPVPLKKDPEVEENFGYKEPARKTDNKDDKRQLTLW